MFPYSWCRFQQLPRTTVPLPCVALQLTSPKCHLSPQDPARIHIPFKIMSTISHLPPQDSAIILLPLQLTSTRWHLPLQNPAGLNASFPPNGFIVPDGIATPSSYRTPPPLPSPVSFIPRVITPIINLCQPLNLLLVTVQDTNMLNPLIPLTTYTCH